MAEIPFLKLDFAITPEDIIDLPPFKGSTFRGGFGHAFRRVVCALKKTDCQDCLLKEKCVYAYIFETSTEKGREGFWRGSAIPHPYLIEPPLTEQTRFLAGTEINFSLILFGKATDYVPYFIYTFEELGAIGLGRSQGRYRIKTVAVREALSKKSEIIYSGQDKTLKPFKDYRASVSLKMRSDPERCPQIGLKFLTPARILSNGKLLLDLEFHTLISSLLRRVSEVYCYHCEGDVSDWDFKGLIDRARGVKTTGRELQWYDWERYSSRQDARQKLGGFLGTIFFEGELTEFIPLIRAGEVLHVGKNTSFGLGKYEILHL